MNILHKIAMIGALFAVAIAAPALTSCETATTTVTNPDGSTTVTSKKTLPPAIASSLEAGAVVITGALADRVVTELKPKPPRAVVAQK